MDNRAITILFYSKIDYLFFEFYNQVNDRSIRLETYLDIGAYFYLSII